MSRLKWIAIGLGSIAVFVVAVIGVENLVASSVHDVTGEASRGYWTEAITAVSTVIVMAATTVYAVITYQMVQTMKRQTFTMAAAPTRAHVTELSRFLTTWITSLLALKGSVGPGGLSTVDSIAGQDKAADRVSSSIFELASFASACPPNIIGLIRPVTDAVNNALEMVHLLRKSIVLAARTAMTGNLPFQEDLLARTLSEAGSLASPGISRAMDPSWDDVRDAYLLHVRDGAAGKPEWDYIISGRWHDDVLVPWSELMTACTSYLLAPMAP